MTIDHLNKMDTARHLLPEPAPAVVGELISEVRALRSKLASAEYTFDLLAGYGLPDEDRCVCFAAMKDIAAEARDKLRT